MPGGLPELTDAQRATTTLNVKATPEQLADPQWHEKVELVHSAYLRVKDSTGYSTQRHKIRVFTQPFPSGTCIAVGSTKDTIAKFWVGVGALKPHAGSFRQVILSPKQLEAARFHGQDIAINGLSGKNFSHIRVLDAETETTTANAAGLQATQLTEASRLASGPPLLYPKKEI